MSLLAIVISLALALAGPPTPTPTPAPLASTTPAPKTAFDYAKAGREAYAAGDMPGFLRSFTEAARRRPGDIGMLYNLACAQARNGQTRAAVATLQDIVAHRVEGNLDADADFESIRNDAGYKDVMAKMAALKTLRVTSGAAPAFTVAEKGLVPEGVAYDPVTRSFFLASIRQRKILRIGPDGKASDFVTSARDGLRSATGMAVDPKRRILFVASEAMPHMTGYREGDPPDSAVFAYDVDSGKLRAEIRPEPETEKPAAFDDLTLAPDGRLYVNDGQNPRVFTLAPGGSRLEVFLESAELSGTQGLAVTPDGKTLYLSDYSGLVAIDVASRRITPIPVPPDLALSGIDGLAYVPGGSLVAIQNGIQPARVIRLDLAPDGVSVRRSAILEMNHPAFAEPTLGVVVGDRFYFTANSQGGRFLDKAHPIDPGEMQDAVVLQLRLAPREP